jgi:hypothetical protein
MAQKAVLSMGRYWHSGEKAKGRNRHKFTVLLDI